MSYSKTDYYAEGLAESFEEHGVTATPEQIKAIASDVACWTENIGMAFYQPSDPAPSEADRLRAELQKERSKVTCKQCNGSGSIVSHGPYHSATSSCWKCGGDGRHAP